MKFVIAVLSASVGLVCGVNWVRICEESSGNKCCNVDSSATADLGMGVKDKYHEYWIIRSTGSWTDLDIQCQLERTGAKLAIFENQRENDCVAKYLSEEFEGDPASDYAFGIKADEPFDGIYEWHRLESATVGAQTLAFKNWASTAPTGKSCVVMGAGLADKNGRWTDVECGTGTFFGICEYDPVTSD